MEAAMDGAMEEAPAADQESPEAQLPPEVVKQDFSNDESK